jgi:outer membrane protein TolC
MSARTALAAVAVSAVTLIAGCASTHGLAPTASPRDANALAAQRSLRDAHAADAAWPARDWWKALDDAQLDALIDEAVRDSPTLKVAAARTRKAIAAADAAAAPLSPRIDGSASSTRERFPNNGLTPPPLGGSTRTVNELQATLSWEIDFWGKNRAAYEAALGAARAAEVDAYAARLAQSTNIAQAFVQ